MADVERSLDQDILLLGSRPDEGTSSLSAVVDVAGYSGFSTCTNDGLRGGKLEQQRGGLVWDMTRQISECVFSS